MTPQDKQDLRALRDDTIDDEDKKLLRKAINHIQSLEQKNQAVQTLLRMAMNELKGKGDD